jgi:WD40 repeat protein/serine/threonine protein kinase
MSEKVSESSANYVLLTRLADEFAARYRAGEPPALQEYIDRYPELADEIRELFPAMVEMEQVKEDHQEVTEQAAAPSAPALQQLGDFRIIREVGKGGMGIVYEAEQVSLGRHVALKVLPKTMLLDARAKRRFEREAKSAARLHHTNIVPVFGVGEQDGLPYYVMQFIQGLGLDEVLDELKKLQIGSAENGKFTGGQMRISRTVGQVPNLPERGRQVENLPHDHRSAANMARSLLTGELHGMDDQNVPDAAPVAEDPRREEDRGTDAFRSPAPSDSFTLSSSSVVLPGQSRDRSKPRNRKQTYWQSVASIGVQVAEALDYAHKQGVQHRDIKPSNLLLDTQGTMWVTDFGLAKADDQQNLTHTGDILGTLRYMPPEAFEGKTDARGDVYSLGLTLYEMLAFRPAFDEKERNRLIKQVTHEEPLRLGKLNRSVPRDLETIVHKAIDREPRQRYQTASDLAADLQRFIDDEPIQARRASVTERSWRWCKRNPVVAGLSAAVFGLLVVVAAVASVGYVQTRLALSREASEHAEADRQRAEAQRERDRAETNLYHSLVREAQAIRRLRNNGYRKEVWDRLRQALELETPDKDPAQLRQEAVACLGDFVGLAPTTWTVTGDIRALEAHPDSRQVAIGLEDGTLLLCDLATGAEIARLQEHHAPVVGLSFASAGNRMASADLAGMVKLWQANPGSGWVCVRTIPIDRPTVVRRHSETNRLLMIALTSDGKSLVTYSSPQAAVVLWNLADGTRTATFDLPGQGRLNGLALSPGGKLLAAAYSSEEGHRLLVWEVAQRTLTLNLGSDLGEIFNLAFSSKGQYLAYVGNEGGAMLVAPKFERVNLARFGMAVSVHFSPDDKLLALVDYQFHAIRLWETATNGEVAVLSHPSGRVGFVRFSEDGNSLVAAGRWPSTVRIWKLTDAHEKLVLRAHVGGAPHVAFSPDGKLLASAGKDRTVRIWNPATGRLLKELTGFRREVETAAFSPDGSLLATGDYASEIRFWQLPSWQELPPLGHPLGPEIWACAFSPDGRFFAACGQGGLAIWKVVARPADGRPGPRPFLEQLARPSDRVITSLSFSPNGNLLAWTSSKSMRLHLWDASNSRPYLFPPLNVNSFVRTTAFYPDAKKLVFIGSGGRPEVWNLVTRQRVYPSGPHDFGGSREGDLPVVALNAAGTWLAANRDRGSVAVWDLQKRELLLALPEEHGFVWGLAWAPNHELLAGGFSDGSVVLWNIPRVRAQLAEIGLDWQDSPLPAPRPELAEAASGPQPVETTCLFALEQFGTANAALTTEGNACRVDVTAVDGTHWHARLTQVFDDLQEGATYTVRFRAKADAPRPMRLYGQIDEPDWHTIGLNQVVPLTEGWQTFQYEFRAKDLGESNAIQFHLGARTGIVWIADFTLTKEAK